MIPDRRISSALDPIMNMKVGDENVSLAKQVVTDKDISPLDRPPQASLDRARKIIHSLSKANRRYKKTIADIRQEQMVLVNLITMLLGVSGFLVVVCIFFIITSAFG